MIDVDDTAATLARRLVNLVEGYGDLAKVPEDTAISPFGQGAQVNEIYDYDAGLELRCGIASVSDDSIPGNVTFLDDFTGDYGLPKKGVHVESDLVPQSRLSLGELMGLGQALRRLERTVAEKN